MELLIIILFSYLLGSIPFGYILIKKFLKKDIRKIGSGNIGATNALRAGNKLLGSNSQSSLTQGNDPCLLDLHSYLYISPSK